MTGPNGHAQDKGASTSVVPPISAAMAAPTQSSPEKVKALVAELEVTFNPAQIEWRCRNTWPARFMTCTSSRSMRSSGRGRSGVCRMRLLRHSKNSTRFPNSR